MRLGSRENRFVLAPGLARQQIAHTLNTAYADGLLSEDTFAWRLDQLLKARLIDPRRLVGDLYLRSSGRGIRARLAAALRAAVAGLKSFVSGRGDERSAFLALDWSGEQRELLIGRHTGCDVVLSDPCVSRHHARLFFRDGGWYLQDLDSTNGTVLNGVRIGRCRLRPGDRLVVGDEHLQID
jgi:FHA domain